MKKASVSKHRSVAMSSHKKHASKHKHSDFFPSWKDLAKRGLISRFLVFFGLLLLRQPGIISTVSVESQPMTFSFEGSAADWGVNETGTKVHGAASQWDYLFSDDSTSTTTTPSTPTTTPSSTTDNEVLHEKDYIPPTQDEINESGSSQSGKVAVGDGNSKTPIVVSPSDDESNTAVIADGTSESTTPPQACATPWGEMVPHKEFILAYQQRKDVNTICDVQKRYCFNGKLTGSYKQQSCKQDVTYNYTDVDPVSVNNQDQNDLVQPSDPENAGASFDVHGKLNGQTTVIDTWPDGQHSTQTSSVNVGQSSTASSSCTTAWGEKVKNGQFVKAYKASIGLSDMPCEVEIRLCTNGFLKGHYTNRTCLVKNMTYRDYLVGNLDSSKPTVADLANATDTEEQKNKQDSSAFWTWLSKYF